VPIHAWAAAYAKAGALPASLVDLRRTFPEGCPAGVHPYHVAGSFVGFLIDRHGIAKVKQWYVDSTEAHAHFGAGVARLEREWREWLAKFPLDPAHEKHVMRKLGRDSRRCPRRGRRRRGRRSSTGSRSGARARGRRPMEREGRRADRHQRPAVDARRDDEELRREGRRAGEAEARERERREAPRERRQGGDLRRLVELRDGGAGFVATAGQIPVGQWVDLVVVDEGGRRASTRRPRRLRRAGLWGDATGGSLAIGVERGVVEIKEWVVFEP